MLIEDNTNKEAKARKPAVPRRGDLDLSESLSPKRLEARPKSSLAEAELDAMLQVNYESRIRELTAENHRLRLSVKDMSHQLDVALKANACGSVQKMEEGVFELPFELSQGSLESHVQDKIEALSSHQELVETPADRWEAGNENQTVMAPVPVPVPSDVLPSPLRRLRENATASGPQMPAKKRPSGPPGLAPPTWNPAK